MKNKFIIVVLLSVLLFGFLFSKGPVYKKVYLKDNSYSVFARPYVYTEFFCMFSMFDCNRAGVIYLYDEHAGKVLESIRTPRIDAIESLKIDPSGNAIYFTAFDDVDLKNGEWVLPRVLKQ